MEKTKQAGQERLEEVQSLKPDGVWTEEDSGCLCFSEISTPVRMIRSVTVLRVSGKVCFIWRL